MRLHDLRHAHATILLQQGVHPKIVQERLGHSTVATTLDIYSHVLPGLQEAAARRFDEGLESALTEAQVAEVLKKNVGKVAFRGGSGVIFRLGRGVRVVDGAALEKRSPLIAERGFESHPLRHQVSYGEVLEWSIRRAWRARVAFGDRGFESHPLRSAISPPDN